MKSLRNAQGTVEYLIIIAIIVVISLVVTGLLSQSLGPTESISDSANKVARTSGAISVNEVIVDSDRNALISLGNNAAGNLTITRMSIDGQDSNYANVSLPQGDEKLFSIVDAGTVCRCDGGYVGQKTCAITIYAVSESGLPKEFQYDVTIDCVSDVIAVDNNRVIPPEIVIPEIYFAINAGGSNSDQGMSLATDSSFNSYITGDFSGTGQFGSTNLNSVGTYDVFVAKVNKDGNWLWARGAGSTGDDFGNSIAVDSNSNVYVTGYFNGTASFGATTLVSSGNQDIFVAKLDKDGNWLWAKRAGGTGFDNGTKITVDLNGNPYLISYVGSVTSSFGNYSIFSNAAQNAVVAKLNSSDGNFVWVQLIRGAVAGGIALDSGNNIYSSGYFSSSAAFGNIHYDNGLGRWVGTFTLDSNNFTFDAFVAKLDNDGNTWRWANKAGGSAREEGASLAVDLENRVYFTGSFGGAALFGQFLLEADPTSDAIFVASLGRDGNWLWATKANGVYPLSMTSNYKGNGISVDSNSNVYVTGKFYTTAHFGSIDVVSNGASDAFLAKLNPSGEWIWATSAGAPVSYESGNDLKVDFSGNIYSIGTFVNNTAFGETELSPNGGSDVFVWKTFSN
jgi:hypothetical protein